MSDKTSEGFEEGLLIGMILVDIKNVFDTIHHKFLLLKLKAIRFSEQSIHWFRSYLCNRIFLVKTENKLSDFEKITCGVPQGSILGPLLLLISANDMPQAVTSKLLLYADDSCYTYQCKDIAKIEKIPNEYFENICDWSVDNKLSIHFGNEKTKSILYASKRRAKSICKLNMRYKEINIKQQAQVTYLGCAFDESMSCEPMALKVNKINEKLKLLYSKN